MVVNGRRALMNQTAKRCRASGGDQARLARLDLQREVFRVDARLREAAGDEPKARLRGAREHVAQLLAVAESPDRADARGDVVAEELAHEVLLALPPRRQHDQVGAQYRPVLHAGTFGDELGDVRKLREADLAVGDEVRAADVEVVAAAAREIQELPSGPFLAVAEPEPFALQPVEERAVELLRVLRGELVRLSRERERH